VNPRVRKAPKATEAPAPAPAPEQEIVKEGGEE
jgi:hypothetical protein